MINIVCIPIVCDPWSLMGLPQNEKNKKKYFLNVLFNFNWGLDERLFLCLVLLRFLRSLTTGTCRVLLFNIMINVPIDNRRKCHQSEEVFYTLCLNCQYLINLINSMDFNWLSDDTLVYNNCLWQFISMVCCIPFWLHLIKHWNQFTCIIQTRNFILIIIFIFIYFPFGL